jgi:hypothetical protein
MKKITLFLQLFLLVLSPLFGQNMMKLQDFSVSKTAKTTLDTTFSVYQTCDFDYKTLNQVIKQEKQGINFEWHLPNLPKLFIQLRPYDLRSPQFVAHINGSSKNLPAEMQECITFKGTINNNENDVVLLTITNTYLAAQIQIGKETYHIEPIANHVYGEKGFVLFQDKNILSKNTKTTCGTAEQPALPNEISTNISTDRLTNCKVLEVAMDADYSFWDRYKENTYGVMIGNMFVVASVYKSTFNLNFVITYAGYYDTQLTCPYYGSAGGAEAYLLQAKNHWLIDRVGIKRDLVHLFSGDPFGFIIGYALQLGAICREPDNSFCVTSDYFRPYLDKIIAHEIGHLLNATHDGASCPIFGTNSIMCPNANNSELEFSIGSQSQINIHLMQYPYCFNDMVGLCDAIIGADQICETDEQEQSYFMAAPSYPWQPSIIWEKTGNIEWVTPPLSSSTSVRVRPTGSGVAYITARINLNSYVDCPIQVFTKKINLGTAAITNAVFANTYITECKDVFPLVVFNGTTNAEILHYEYYERSTDLWLPFVSEPPPFSNVFNPDLFTINGFRNWYINARYGACLAIPIRITPENGCGIGETVYLWLEACKGAEPPCRVIEKTEKEIINIEPIFVLSPNPAANVVQLTSKNNHNHNHSNDTETSFSYKVYNSLGVLVYENATFSPESSFSVQTWADGIYTVIVQSSNSVKALKLAVQKGNVAN